MATTDLISSEPHHQSSVGVVASNKTDAVPHGDSHSIDLSWRDRLVITMNRGSHHFGKRVAQWLVRLAILMIGSVVAIFDLLSMPYYLVKQKPWLKWPKLHRQRSVPDPNNPDRPGQIVRCAIRELPEHFLRECRTIDEALERGIEKEGRSRECIGYREVLSSEPGFDLEGKPLTKYELSDYKWLTYGQMYDQIVRFGHGLRQLGAGKQDKVMIFADTSARWFITGQAIIKNGSVLTTLYATVGDQGQYQR